MASVFDVAARILESAAPMSAMKLQKLVYYSQAWCLAWTEQPLFDEQIQAWANGPVVRELFKAHQGRFVLSGPLEEGDSGALTEIERGVVDRVVRAYDHLSAAQLSALTHSERPWIEARGDLPPTCGSATPIDVYTMLDFYSGLKDAKDAVDVEALATE